MHLPHTKIELFLKGRNNICTMKLYTKAGDEGKTSLFNGTKVMKNDLRVVAYGEIDELNAILGIISSKLENMLDNYEFIEGADTAIDFQKVKQEVATVNTAGITIQKLLFELGSELANPDTSVARITTDNVSYLEELIDAATAATPKLQAFILPGGTEVAVFMHLARTVTRRTERSIIALQQVNPINKQILIFINRLSDLFFAWARYLNYLTGTDEVEWHPRS